MQDKERPTRASAADLALPHRPPAAERLEQVSRGIGGVGAAGDEENALFGLPQIDARALARRTSSFVRGWNGAGIRFQARRCKV